MEQKAQTIQVTKDMTIGEVVKKYPAAIEPLQEAGVHCVGCHVSYHETLEQGLKGHGMSDEEVDSILEAINKAVAESAEEGEKEIIVTKKAAAKLIDILKENNKEGFGLRVAVVKGGCSGFQYGLELDESTSTDDKVYEEKGVKIIIAKENFDFLKGSKIDFVESLHGGGFKITNPNVTSSCGCGQSFH
jgi:iron-sulfur cluster assembly accessory protein